MTKWLHAIALVTACTGSVGGADGGDDNEGSGSGSGSNPHGDTPPGFLFGAYKDTGIHMNWNTNVISTALASEATPTPLADELSANGAKRITLAFATGECGAESWGGVPGATMAQTNAPLLAAAGIDYLLSTGGAAGAFTCASDAAFETFVARWDGQHLAGIDFDIEAGQSPAVIGDLVARITAAHAARPALRFSLTLATLANTDGAPSLNVYGTDTLAAVTAKLGWDGQTAATWPSYVTVNLMTMDYGAPAPGVCVVGADHLCDMGASAIQAAQNLHATFHVPLANIELTPMIGGNDAQDEHFTLADTDAVAAFAIGNGLAGVHYWSYDRDVDCPPSSASPTCNTLGTAGAHGFLQRFLADGL